ncbi:MAG: permease [Candidatus Tenebribacter mawsonii]|nr:permease [Candidatus Tenebribacter mawsonii]
MIQKFKKSGIDIKMGFLLIGISIVLMMIFNINFSQLIISNSDIIIKIIYLTAIAMMISTAIHFLIPENFAEKHLRDNKLSHLFYATLLGVLTPGPVYAIYPIVIVLKKKGIKNPILVAFLTGQTIIGPARAPFEIGFFGLKFYIYRILLALIMGPIAALLFIFLSKFWPDKERNTES